MERRNNDGKIHLPLLSRHYEKQKRHLLQLQGEGRYHHPHSSDVEIKKENPTGSGKDMTQKEPFLTPDGLPYKEAVQIPRGVYAPQVPCVMLLPLKMFYRHQKRRSGV